MQRREYQRQATAKAAEQAESKVAAIHIWAGCHKMWQVTTHRKNPTHAGNRSRASCAGRLKSCDFAARSSRGSGGEEKTMGTIDKRDVWHQRYEASKLMRSARARKFRVAKHGIRVLCAGCGTESRHFTGVQPRLRDRSCACGGSMHARWWCLRYPSKWHAVRKRIRGLDPLDANRSEDAGTPRHPSRPRLDVDVVSFIDCDEATVGEICNQLSRRGREINPESY